MDLCQDVLLGPCHAHVAGFLALELCAGCICIVLSDGIGSVDK